MSRSKYSEEETELIINIYNKKKNISKTAERFCEIKNLRYTDQDRRNISNLLSREGITKSLTTLKQEEEDITVDNLYNEAKKRKLNTSKYYIITWEQNHTPLHQTLWKNILKYKEFLDAELSVILGRYKNPTSVFTDKEQESWNNDTRPYWDANRHDIHKYLTILGDVKIQPTAANPLTGLESITGETTTIIGHPKMWLKPVPVLEGHPKKILLSTGAITVPNYTDS